MGGAEMSANRTAPSLCTVSVSKTIKSLHSSWTQRFAWTKRIVRAVYLSRSPHRARSVADSAASNFSGVSSATQWPPLEVNGRLEQLLPAVFIHRFGYAVKT
jgi:hypothetical protein